MTDVRLYQTPDGGEIEILAGQAVMNDGLETASFLSLFGGNQEDSGLEGDDPKQWWANLSESEPSRRYRSETQHLLRALPATSANLRRIEDAAARDLAWMQDELDASIDVEATIPALNWVRIRAVITIGDRRFEIVFDNIWKRLQ